MKTCYAAYRFGVRRQDEAATALSILISFTSGKVNSKRYRAPLTTALQNRTLQNY